MKKLILAVVVMFSMGSVMAQQKIAHVNSQKLLDSLPSRQAAIKTLRDFEAEGMKELQEMQADFETAVAAYNAKKPSMPPVMIPIEEDKLMKKQQSIQDREQSLNTELQTISNSMNEPILERLQKAVEIVSERKKLSYVIDESTTLYHKGGMDIQAEVKVELLRLDAESMKK